MSVRPSLIEFPADDTQRARRFWEGLLDVALTGRAEAEGSGWQTRESGAGPVVGLHERGRGPGDSFSLPYFAVDDIDGALARVTELGGTVRPPRRQVGDLQGLRGESVRSGAAERPVDRPRRRVLSSFADIPDEIRRRVAGGERVVLVLLDALGLEFLRRHPGHPLVKRLEVTPLRSQFPSTTTAHVTTAHFGLPVEDHGLYEWNVLEPAIDAIICPLRFNLAGSEVEGTLAGRLDPAALAPGPTFYETLGRPHGRAPAAEDRGFRVHPPGHARGDPAGIRRAGRGRSGAERGLCASAGSARSRVCVFVLGPDRPGRARAWPELAQFETASRNALDALWNGLGGLRDVSVLITADHGQVDVSPDRVDYLDDLWPALPVAAVPPPPGGLLARRLPARARG